MEILKWLRSEGCPWDGKTSEYAAQHGNLDVLKYLQENGCPWDETKFWLAAGEVQELLRENNCPGPSDEYSDEYSDDYS